MPRFILNIIVIANVNISEYLTSYHANVQKTGLSDQVFYSKEGKRKKEIQETPFVLQVVRSKCHKTIYSFECSTDVVYCTNWSQQKLPEFDLFSLDGKKKRS